MFISLSTQIYPDLPWLYLGCLEAWLSWRWWWSTMAKRHLASSLTIWMWGLRRSMGNCPRTCCPRIWIHNTRFAAQHGKLPSNMLPKDLNMRFAMKHGKLPDNMLPRNLESRLNIKDPEGQILKDMNLQQRLNISILRARFWRICPERFAAANADYGVIETSPSMKLAAQCIILHLERDKVVVRGEQKDFLVFILGTTQPLSHGHLIWSLHLAELVTPHRSSHARITPAELRRWRSNLPWATSKLAFLSAVNFMTGFCDLSES